MAWFYADDALFAHPKVKRAVKLGGLQTMGLWLLAGCYVRSYPNLNETGFIPAEFVDEHRARKIAEILVKSELWDAAPGGWSFHDWKDWHGTAEQREELRKAKDRARKSRDRERALRGSSADVPRTVHGTSEDISADVPRTSAEVPESPARARVRPLPLSKEPNGSLHASADNETAFDEFWDVYPRHIGKKAARAKFLTATKTTPPDAIIEGARRYVSSLNGSSPRYVKHPTTWLNQGCWDDEHQTQQPLNAWEG